MTKIKSPRSSSGVSFQKVAIGIVLFSAISALFNESLSISQYLIVSTIQFESEATTDLRNQIVKSGEPSPESNSLAKRNQSALEANHRKNFDQVFNYEFDLSIPERMPLNTIDPKDFTQESLGEATIDMFRGKWVDIKPGEPYYSYDQPQPFCPQMNETFWRWGTCSENSGLRVAKKYVADGLRPFNATQFMHFFMDKGPLFMVGDSLSGQSFYALKCMVEAGGAYMPRPIRSLSRPIVVPTKERMETLEIRVNGRGEESQEEFFDTELEWAERAIKSKASYVLFNFGTWYSAKIFYIRKTWCDHTEWKRLKESDILKVYEETMRLVLLPKLRKLVAHGVIPIWRDTSPGGIWDQAAGDIAGAPYFLSWKLHPVYNRVGRKITQEAGGLVLPLFDMSMARSEDHVQSDATYTDNDRLHWCNNYSPNAVPHVWIQLLQNILMDENGESHASTSTPHQKVEESKEGRPKGYNYERKFDVQNTFSKSGESPCPCSAGHNYFMCVANIKCQWVNSTKCV